jgi:hypothetical protein
MAKDYLTELENELNEAGSLTKALDKGAGQDPGEDLAGTVQPEQKFTVSPEAKAGLEKFRIKLIGHAEIIIKELLEAGILVPDMSSGELPAFLKDYREKLMKD